MWFTVKHVVVIRLLASISRDFHQSTLLQCDCNSAIIEPSALAQNQDIFLEDSSWICTRLADYSEHSQYLFKLLSKWRPLFAILTADSLCAVFMFLLDRKIIFHFALSTFYFTVSHKVFWADSSLALLKLRPRSPLTWMSLQCQLRGPNKRI